MPPRVREIGGREQSKGCGGCGLRGQRGGRGGYQAHLTIVGEEEEGEVADASLTIENQALVDAYSRLL